ncbi:MAG: LytR C-terminal domain-containing protein [Ignavibacteriaceae bacterium]|nr:LytR C-terminal domain-containing protein [Ignavibacteriaceae bacterium]NUM71096.1 LytR C-terminal domain-containing protein [Ignavibacteriaceae bacterium]
MDKGEGSLNKDEQFKSYVLNVLIIILVALPVYLTYHLYTILFSSSEEKPKKEVVVAAKLLQIDVLNGCGQAGIGEKFTDFLRQQKFDVINTGNFVSFDVENTIVVDRKGNPENALRVARSLGLTRESVVQNINKDYLIDVTVIIGRDYKELNVVNKNEK